MFDVLQDAALARLTLDPENAGHPELVAHFQRLLETLLVARVAMTRVAFARIYYPDAPAIATH